MIGTSEGETYENEFDHSNDLKGYSEKDKYLSQQNPGPSEEEAKSMTHNSSQQEPSPKPLLPILADKLKETNETIGALMTNREFSSSEEGGKAAADLAFKTLGYGVMGAERGAVGVLGGALSKLPKWSEKLTDSYAKHGLETLQHLGHPLEDMSPEDMAQAIQELNVQHYWQTGYTPEKAAELIQHNKTIQDTVNKLLAYDPLVKKDFNISSLYEKKNFIARLYDEKKNYLSKPNLKEMEDLTPEERESRIQAGGFTTKLYHGTRQHFTEGEIAKNTYATSAPELADLYAGVPAKYALRRIEPTANAPVSSGARVVPMLANTKDYHEIDAGGKTWTDFMGKMHKALNDAEDAGKPGLIIRNIFDEPSGSDKELEIPKDIYVILKGNTVRSPSANFNPKKFGLNDFLAGIGGVAVTAAASKKKEKD